MVPTVGRIHSTDINIGIGIGIGIHTGLVKVLPIERNQYSTSMQRMVAMQITPPDNCGIKGGTTATIVDSEGEHVAIGTVPERGGQQGQSWQMTTVKQGRVALEKVKILAGKEGRAMTVFPVMDVSDARIFSTHNLHVLSKNKAPDFHGGTVLDIGVVLSYAQIRVPVSQLEEKQSNNEATTGR